MGNRQATTKEEQLKQLSRIKQQISEDKKLFNRCITLFDKTKIKSQLTLGNNLIYELKKETMLKMRQQIYRRESVDFVRQAVRRKSRFTLVEKYQINQTDYTSIQLAFRSSYFLKHITFSQLDKLIEDFEFCRAARDEVLLSKDQDRDILFIIYKGTCQLEQNKMKPIELKDGEIFGQDWLIYNNTAEAVRVISDEIYFYTLGLQHLELLSYNQKENHQNRVQAIINQIVVFDFLNDKQRLQIAHHSYSFYYSKGQVLVHAKQQNYGVFIVVEGEIEVDSESAKQLIGPMGIFGNIYQQNHNDVTATKDNTLVLYINYNILKQICKEQYEQILFYLEIFFILQKDPKLRYVHQVQKKKILQSLAYEQYQEQKIVLYDVKCTDKIVFVIKGRLVLIVEDRLQYPVTDKGGYFADQSLKLHKRQIVATAGSVLGIMDLTAFRNILSGDPYYQEPIYKIDLAKAEVLDDFSHADYKSTYRIAHSTDTYVVKIYKKALVEQQQLHKHLQQEVQVVQKLNSPFIVGLKQVHSDSHQVYLVMEDVPGMALSDLLQQIGLLDLPLARLYLGYMMLMISDLHGAHVVHRDLKPENMMVMPSGALKLIDLNSAKCLESERTFTIVGTPHYTAPEIITGKGYSFTVDYWSMGVCLYEFLCAGLPFAEQEEDPYSIYEQIIKSPLAFPGYLDNADATALLQQLLSKMPELRLRGGIRQHPFFSSLDWTSLQNHQVVGLHYPKRVRRGTQDMGINITSPPAGKPVYFQWEQQIV